MWWGFYWIYLVQDRNELQVVLNTVMNLMFIGPCIFVITEE